MHHLSQLDSSPFFSKPFTLAEWPVDRPRNWAAAVNEPLAEGDLAAVRTSIRRGRPLGEPAWVQKTARRLGLEFTLRNPGRPRGHGNE